MRRRLQTALPLIFAFLLTLLPLMLLQYNQFQRNLVASERQLTQWEQKANNYLELFRSLWSIEAQIRRRFLLFQSHVIKNPSAYKANGEDFLRGMKRFLPEKLMPATIYAGATDENGENLKLFEGGEFAPFRRRFFENLLTGLIRQDRINSNDSRRFNSIVRGAFGDNLDFELLKDFRRGKPTRVVFRSELSFLYWDSYTLESGEQIVYLCTFSHDMMSKIESMQFTARLLSRHYPEVSAVLVPLELADASTEAVFATPASSEQRAIIKSVMEISGDKDLIRDQKFPFGEFFTEKNYRVCREFIDYSVPYELWIMSGEPLDLHQQESPLSIFFRIFYFAIWALVILKVLITGRPIGISLKVWLSFIFIVVGLVPLIVFYMAGIFHIDASSYRREQEAIIEMLQQLEEADASGESLLAEYRDLFISLTRDKDWLKLMEKMDPDAWQIAWDKLPEKFARAGLNIDVMFVYPPDQASASARLFTNKYGNVDEAREMQNFAFYADWIRKGYFRFVPEKMTGPEPGLPLFRDKAGEEVLRLFLSNRGDIEFLDFGSEKHFLYQDYILKNGKPHNWYFLKVNMMPTFERFLERSIAQLQDIFSDHIYAIATLEDSAPKILFPRHQGGRVAALMNVAGKWIDLAAITGTHMIDQTEDYLVVTYPCVKSGPYIITGVVKLSGFRAQAYQQEKILSLIVLIMTLPVLLISRFASNHLVKPLMKVESGLRRIAEENYSVELQLKRNDELGRLSVAFDSMVEGLKERKNLGKFVSATLDEYVARDDQAAFVGLEKRFGAILCSDIRGFTKLSEQYPVRDIVEMLNQHLTEISQCISSHGGLVEQFIGDEVLAVFHGKTEAAAAEKAVAAAQMIMARHSLINEHRESENNFSYEIGVGISSGELLSGIVTAGRRREYAVIGPLRSQAEKLEACSKLAVQTKIVVSDKIVKMLEHLSFVKLSDGSGYELESCSGVGR